MGEAANIHNSLTISIHLFISVWIEIFRSISYELIAICHSGY